MFNECLLNQLQIDLGVMDELQSVAVCTGKVRNPVRPGFVFALNPEFQSRPVSDRMVEAPVWKKGAQEVQVPALHVVPAQL